MKTITKFICSVVAVISLTIGAITANGALNDLFVSINWFGGNGEGDIYEYTPSGVQSLFQANLDAPRGVAFDHFGNLFVGNTSFDEPTQTYHGTIIKITPAGVRSLFATIQDNFFVQDLVFDHSGNLYVTADDLTDDPNFASTIYKFTPGGVQSTFGNLPFQSFGMVFDTVGNLFAACAGVPEVANSAAIYKFASDGTRSVFVGQSAFGDFNGPIGLAFDRFGNLFASVVNATPAGTDTIVKFSPSGVQSTFATDLDWPWDLGFDRSGNLFVAERAEFAPPGDVLKFTPNGTGTVFAPDLNSPRFLVFQSVPTPRARPTPHPRPR